MRAIHEFVAEESDPEGPCPRCGQIRSNWIHDLPAHKRRLTSGERGLEAIARNKRRNGKPTTIEAQIRLEESINARRQRIRTRRQRMREKYCL